jgi:hypothetical protein
MKETLGFTVIPVKTGIQGFVRLAYRVSESDVRKEKPPHPALDSRFRGNDA